MRCLFGPYAMKDLESASREARPNSDTMALVLRVERRRLPQEVKAVFEEAEKDNCRHSVFDGNATSYKRSNNIAIKIYFCCMVRKGAEQCTHLLSLRNL